MRRSIAASALCLQLIALTGAAADPATVPEIKRTSLALYLTAEEAFEMVRSQPASTLFLDIRSIGEVAFVGMPAMVDANVPYMLQSEWNEWDEAKHTVKLVANLHFSEEVAARLAEKGLTRADPIVLICRSGDRSAAAANVLAQIGYSRVYSVIDGFEGDLAKDGPTQGQRSVNGWKNAHLPWSYTLQREKMYRPEK